MSKNKKEKLSFLNWKKRKIESHSSYLNRRESRKQQLLMITAMPRAMHGLTLCKLNNNKSE